MRFFYCLFQVAWEQNFIGSPTKTYLFPAEIYMFILGSNKKHMSANQVSKLALTRNICLQIKFQNVIWRSSNSYIKLDSLSAGLVRTFLICGRVIF